MKTSILFVIGQFNIGGVEKSLLGLLNSLPADKYDITIGAIRAVGGFRDLVPAHVKVIEIASIRDNFDKLPGRPSSVLVSLRQGRVLEAIGSFISIVRSRIEKTLIPHYRYFINEKTDAHMPEYDVAIAFQGPSEIVDYYVSHVVKARRKFGWIHFDINGYFTRPETVRRCYRSFSRIMIVSESAKSAFDTQFPEFADKTEVMFNIIDAKANIRMADTPGVFIPAKDCINIVTVGRISPAKAQDIAIKAAAILRDRGVKFKWHMVGDGPKMQEYKKLAEEYNLGDSVVFEGATPNPYPYMKGCDVYVQPSRHEGFCIAIGEAKLFGVPIVATDFIGAHEQLDGVSNARVIPSPDPALMADAVLDAASAGRIVPDAPGIPPQVLRLNELFGA